MRSRSGAHRMVLRLSRFPAKCGQGRYKDALSVETLAECHAPAASAFIEHHRRRESQWRSRALSLCVCTFFSYTICACRNGCSSLVFCSAENLLRVTKSARASLGFDATSVITSTAGRVSFSVLQPMEEKVRLVSPVYPTPFVTQLPPLFIDIAQLCICNCKCFQRVESDGRKKNCGAARASIVNRKVRWMLSVDGRLRTSTTFLATR